MLRPFALLLALAATDATADCTGPSLLDHLDDAKRLSLQAAVEATPFGQGLLWSAERDGARVLIAGTMHLPDPRHAATLAALAPAIRDADLVLLEATPVEVDAMTRAMAEDPSLAVITDGPTLPELLPPEDWARVADAARSRGLPPFLVAKYRPWLLMMTLSMPPCAMQDLAGGEGGLDTLIMDRAQADGTPMAPLEPWDTLFRLMAADDPAEQARMLALSLLDPGPAEEMLVAMREGYFAGRIAEVWALNQVTLDLAPDPQGHAAEVMEAMEDDLLTQRNAAWIPVIEDAAARNPRLLVAAGAAHLPGENGVLRRLERDGWTIGPLLPETCCEGFWLSP